MGKSDLSSALQYQIINTIMKCMGSENSSLLGSGSKSDDQSGAFNAVLQSLLSAASEGGQSGSSSDGLLGLLGSNSVSDPNGYSSLSGMTSNSLGTKSLGGNYYGTSKVSPQTSSSSKINVSNSTIEEAVDTASKKYGVDKNLILSVIQQESSFNPNSTSGVGAMGLMQLMPGTAKELGVTDAYDINQNVDGGTKYLKNLLNTFGDYKTAVAAYNAGPGAVKRSDGDISKLPYETRDYVTKVSKYYTQGV